MRHGGIKRLDWDSDFFNIEAAEISEEITKDTKTLDLQKYDLLVFKHYKDLNLHIPNFDIQFQETKVIFSKFFLEASIKNSNVNVLDFDDFPIEKKLLYPLAFESGKHSRFKLDANIKLERFQLLYKKWVDNSVLKLIADKIFYVMDVNEIIGFVTVKIIGSYASIGLIAVSEKFQGKGLGKKLLMKVEQFCASEKIFELRIPTQKENYNACKFYSSLGYDIVEEIVIKHYWKLDLNTN